MTAAATISSRIAGQTTAQLKEMAALLVDDMREGTDVVFSAVLDGLMARLPEQEFVSFCGGLE